MSLMKLVNHLTTNEQREQNPDPILVILLMETRNPANSPVEVGSSFHYLQGFFYIPGGAGFLPSTVGSMG